MSTFASPGRSRPGSAFRAGAGVAAVALVAAACGSSGSTSAAAGHAKSPMPEMSSSMPMASPSMSMGGGMAWSARLGKLGLYCVNGRTSELVAAPVPAAELAALAARLPLA